MSSSANNGIAEADNVSDIDELFLNPIPEAASGPANANSPAQEVSV